MSCLPEATYAVYVDGELPAGDLRAVEAHLVGCRDCRTLVLALRSEATLIGDLLHDRVRHPQRLSRPPAPARGIALGVVPSLLVFGTAAAALGWILESALPASIDWLGPFSLRGAYDMAFDLIFLVRDEAPAAFELALAIAAMASVSAILTFALTALLRRWSGPGLLTLACLLMLSAPTPSQAHFGLHEHEDLTIAAGETHDGTLIASAQHVNVDGKVTGDLIVLTERLVVRGEVEGNVIALARHFELRGVVKGAVHVASIRTEISGEVGENLYACSEHLTLAESGEVKRDVVAAFDDAAFDGSIGRDLIVFGERLELRGKIDRHVDARVDALALRGEARVGGDIDARLPPGTEVQIAPGVQVKGETRTVFEERFDRPRLARFLEAHFYLHIALHLGAAFLVGMLLHTFLPGVYGGGIATAGAFFRSMGVGFLAVVATPIAVALACVTLVGIPVALIGLGVYLAALYASGIVVAALLGSALVHPTHAGWTGFGLALLAGLVILIFAFHLPFIGGVLRAMAMLTGVGLLVDRGREAWAATRPAAA